MPQHAAASQNFLGDRWCLPPPPPDRNPPPCIWVCFRPHWRYPGYSGLLASPPPQNLGCVYPEEDVVYRTLDYLVAALPKPRKPQPEQHISAMKLDLTKRPPHLPGQISFCCPLPHCPVKHATGYVDMFSPTTTQVTHTRPQWLACYPQWLATTVGLPTTMVAAPDTHNPTLACMPYPQTVDKHDAISVIHNAHSKKYGYEEETLVALAKNVAVGIDPRLSGSCKAIGNTQEYETSSDLCSPHSKHCPCSLCWCSVSCSMLGFCK